MMSEQQTNGSIAATRLFLQIDASGRSPPVVWAGDSL